jgi:hypothetical protein
MFIVNNIIEMRKAYTADLKTIIDRVFYEDSPPDGTIYPFIVYELIDSTPDGANTEIFDLYINGWDQSSDTTILETLMFNINNLIDKKTYVIDETTLSFRAELNKKLNIKDVDVTLKRREYRYTVNSIQRRT